MQQTSKELYQEYVTLQQKAADINNASAVLGWDQEVYMPPKSAPFRARQLATLATQAHEMLTSDKYERLLTELSKAEGLDEKEKWNVKRSMDDLHKNK